jgi:translation initiation factor 4G
LLRAVSPPRSHPLARSCIQRLLLDDQNPKLEDLECLCKLLSTIGQQLERGGVVKGSAGMTQVQVLQRQKEEAAKGRRVMDAYFQRITRLVENKALDSRLRFMLMDIQEQRSRGWATRRKAEGPMKIEVRARQQGGGPCGEGRVKHPRVGWQPSGGRWR